MAQYEYLDHTADIAIRAWGESPAAALAAMTEGLLALIYEGRPVASRETRCVSAGGDAPDERIVNYFNELLFLIEGERWLPRGVEDIAAGPDRIEALLSGEPFDPARHALAGEIKAATYHDFSLREAEGRWELRMVFDG
jgi:SHS2 domain-containing protein